MSISLPPRAAVLIGGLLLSATAAAQIATDEAGSDPVPTEAVSAEPAPPAAPVAKARVRIFGANGQGITMYTNATCRAEYTEQVEVVRSGARAIGSLFGGAPDNVSLGIPETDSVRNMKSVLFSKPNYQEYAVEGGQPLIFTARIENTNDYRCDGDLALRFVAEPGSDYEVQMSLANGRCLFNARQVAPDGTLRPQPSTAIPAQCPAAGVENASVTPEPSSDVEASAAIDAHAPAAASDTMVATVATPRDWTRTVLITSGVGVGPNGNRDGDATLRLIRRSDTGKVAALKAGQLALSLFGGGNVRGFSKNNLRGENIETVPSPAGAAITAALRTRLAKYFVAHPDTIPYDTQQVQARAGQWSLTYQKLSDGDAPYLLEHDSSISFMTAQGMPSQTVYCRDEPRMASLEEWQADDYAKVKAAAEEIAAQCVARYATELPRLFPELAPLEPEPSADAPEAIAPDAA